MTTAARYAKALFESKNPTVAGLRAALPRRGHLKLMPQIYAEYRKLHVAKARRERHAQVTPEAEQTRVLLELYRNLLNA